MSVSEEELFDSTTEEKIRHLVSLFSTKKPDDIDMTFDIRKDINVDHNYFFEMLAGAITYHFKLETDPETVEAFSTLKDIVDYVDSRQ
ncbi:hypothetical protein V3C99_008370 [Haemonchus contortus]|uniref:Carrier domain-containing protein n=1 Tax=Haemonchus contortus TaxID=6289 RepID=A0A7I4YL90_HAECO|nr:unnamed protein product [Haemonchus contortus]